MYYASYLKFMERARAEWLRALGCDQARMRARHGLQLGIARADIELRRPARFDDRLDVDVRAPALRRASVELGQHVRSTGQELLCHAKIRVGRVGAETFRPRGIPISLQQELELEH